MHHPLILFIIKKNCCYDGGTTSNGLRNSALFVVNMLLAEGIRAKLVDAVDGNSIDALVAQYKPERVVLEAIWVTPEKMAELLRLWPKVKWTVRVHSEPTFLASEGMATEWIGEYLKQGIDVGFNSEDATNDFLLTLGGKCIHLPNYYPLRKPRCRKEPSHTLDVGCFGAIRPLKNQFIQAMAAVVYANAGRQKLRFHMNGTRAEMSGANVLKNIQALLGDKLVLHPWMEHEDFLELVSQMDICLQASLSESFNVTASDAVSMGVPLVGSSAIKWLPERSQAPVGNALAIAQTMYKADGIAVEMNSDALRLYLRKTVKTWELWAHS